MIKITEQAVIIKKAVDYISRNINVKPKIGIILGTGLSSLFDHLEDSVTIPYESVPGLSVCTVSSHHGKFRFGKYKNQQIMIMHGRFHYYEGYTMQEVTLPIRIMKELGVSSLITTNASGSLRKEIEPGTIVLIKDHINFMGSNPLIGINDENSGPRFPSMHEPYCSELRRLAEKIACRNNIKLASGVYIGVAGPNFETVSECRAFASWGADVVGMSTVPEVLAAVHSGISTICFSIVSNYTNLFHDDIHKHEDIELFVSKSYPDLKVLISEVMCKL